VARVTQSVFLDDAVVAGSQARQDAARRLVRTWLSAVVSGMPDRRTGEPFASLAHDQVRPVEELPIRLKGGTLLMGAAVGQAGIMRILAEVIDDPIERARAISAWCRLLFVQLDILLKVHSSIEPTPRWY
jgi:hypothetical protein